MTLNETLDILKGLKLNGMAVSGHFRYVKP